MTLIKYNVNEHIDFDVFTQCMSETVTLELYSTSDQIPDMSAYETVFGAASKIRIVDYHGFPIPTDAHKKITLDMRNGCFAKYLYLLPQGIKYTILHGQYDDFTIFNMKMFVKRHPDTKFCVASDFLMFKLSFAKNFKIMATESNYNDAIGFGFAASPDSTIHLQLSCIVDAQELLQIGQKLKKLVIDIHSPNLDVFMRTTRHYMTINMYNCEIACRCPNIIASITGALIGRYWFKVLCSVPEINATSEYNKCMLKRIKGEQ